MRPWQSREEMLTDVALQSALEGTYQELKTMRPVAGPQQPFPARTGFRQESWTIGEVLGIGRRNPTYRSWLSGMPVRPSVLSDQSWSGTARNSLSEGVW